MALPSESQPAHSLSSQIELGPERGVWRNVEGEALSFGGRRWPFPLQGIRPGS